MEPVSNAGLKPMTPAERLRYLAGKAPSQEEAVKLIIEASDTIQSIQQERDKLLRKLDYKNQVISTALELIEDREKILAIVRPLVDQKWQELIDTVLDSSINVGVGEERT